MDEVVLTNESSAIVTCSTCGFNLPADAVYCGYDGTKLDRRATITATTQTKLKKKCSECSNEFPEYAKFCGIDGADLYSINVPVSDNAKPIALVSENNNPIESSGLTSNRVTRNLSGTILDNKYYLDSILAEGGMAILYRAQHRAMDREVAIKVIHGALLTNPDAIERFRRECLVAAKLNHPNIVSVYDVGFINENEPYLVMELIQGESLAQKLTNQGGVNFPPINGQ
jgi:hypothetical protein